MSTKPTPSLLKPNDERALRTVVNAVVRAHPSETAQSEELRVAAALALLMGAAPPRGPSVKDRDDLLEMLAFDFSVKRYWEKNTDVSITELARKLVSTHPDFCNRAGNEAVVRDLVNKFKANEVALLNSHSYDGSEDVEKLYEPIWRAIKALEEAGVAVEWSALPPGARQGR